MSNKDFCSRFYKLADPNNGILKKGREAFLTGCHLRTASKSCGQARLLPTEYFVVLLDEVLEDFFAYPLVIDLFMYVDLC